MQTQAIKSLDLQANRSVSDTVAVKKLLAEGEEAASFIRTFVVQAKLNVRGNFGKLTWCILQGLCRTNIASHH